MKMKTDNKFRMRLMAAAVIGLAFVLGMTQCKKKIVAVEPQPSDDMIEVTMNASCGGDKTGISVEGAVTWKEGDKIYVVGEEDGLLGYVTASVSGGNAGFIGEITAFTSDQMLRFYYVGNRTVTLDESGNFTFDISSQDGTLAGIARNNQPMYGMSDGEVAVGTAYLGSIKMYNMIAIAKFDISGYDSPAQCEAIVSRTMNAKTGVCTDEGSYGTITLKKPSGSYYMALIPSGSEQTLTFRQDESDDNPVVKSRLIQSGRLYTQSDGSSIEVKKSPITLSGVFSVGSGDADKVAFSRGNMYWDGLENKFKMEDKQWKPMQYVNFANPDNLKFFFWSKDVEVAIAMEYGDPEELSSDMIFTNSADIAPNPGFVVDGETDWRTLSYGEWYHLLNRRTGNRFAKAMLHESCGLLIFPDGYSVTSGTGISTINDANVGFPSQNIPSDTWTVMENDGVVFLPASGYRSGNVQQEIDTYGYYWSSSLREGYPGSVVVMRLYSSNVEFKYSDRDRGCSIRLVKNLSGGEVTGSVGDFEPATWGE